MLRRIHIFAPGGAVEILNMQFQENQCDDDRQRPRGSSGSPFPWTGPINA